MTTEHVLARDIAAFEQMKVQLLEHYDGKFVVFHDAQFHGSFDSFDSAARDALKQFRDSPFLIRQVGAPEVMPMPEAMLFHLDDEGLLGEPGVRLALATALYRSDSVSLGRAAKIAGMALEEFMRHVSRQGIPVVKGDAATVREDVKNLEAWRKRRHSLMRVR